jgi:pimeloyl-ACP methyl ester carboxylesterase
VNPAPSAWLSYDWRGGQERIAAVGDDGPAVLFLAPLFEEANRTRHFLIETMRGVAARGHRCFLPDMPGTLESLTSLASLDWSDWTGAAETAAAAVSATHVVGVRGGALLTGNAGRVLRLAPADGTALMRDLVRIRMAADREDGRTVSAAEVEASALADGFEVAGYRLNRGLVTGLKQAVIPPAAMVRTVRLATDAQTADAKLAGQPLWRRSEPEHDPEFSQLLVDNISHWIETCAAG